MNLLDVIIICILGYSLVRGIFRGLIKELASIVGVIAGLYAARMFYPQISGLMSKWITNVAYREIVGFLIIFCAVLVIVGILGVVIKYVMKIASAGWLDRLLGSIFATVKAVLIVSILLIVLTTFLPKRAAVVKDSLLAPHVMMISGEIVNLIPGEMKQRFFEKFADLKNVWKRI